MSKFFLGGGGIQEHAGGGHLPPVPAALNTPPKSSGKMMAKVTWPKHGSYFVDFVPLIHRRIRHSPGPLKSNMKDV